MHKQQKTLSGLAQGPIVSISAWESRYGMMPEPVTDQARGIIIRRDDAWRVVKLSIPLGIASPSPIRISADMQAVNSFSFGH